MSFIAAGDMAVQRRLHSNSDGFSEIQEYLRKADARYVDPETTLHRGEYYANPFSGGSYLRADPETTEDVKAPFTQGGLYGRPYLRV